MRKENKMKQSWTTYWPSLLLLGLLLAGFVALALFYDAEKHYFKSSKERTHLDLHNIPDSYLYFYEETVIGPEVKECYKIDMLGTAREKGKTYVAAMTKKGRLIILRNKYVLSTFPQPELEAQIYLTPRREYLNNRLLYAGYPTDPDKYGEQIQAFMDEQGNCSISEYLFSPKSMTYLKENSESELAKLMGFENLNKERR